MNPEFRQTLNTLSHNLEAANQTAQENIYTFAQLYIDPCLSGLKSCVHDCTAPCFSSREGSLRRKRGRSRGRAEYSFDFYDDWDDEEETGNSALVWGNDELDSLLAGRGATSSQPGRQRAMSYGARGRRRPGIIEGDPDQDPNIIPSSSYLGFLERLPFKIGAKGLRYKPSAADLQENPGGAKARDEEIQPLIEETEETSPSQRGHGRQRSGTAASRSTTNSLSSRGDLIMSDEEDDAVPLDDEFAVSLSRRTTNTGSEEPLSGKTGSKPGVSNRSTRTVSSKSNKSSNTRRSSSQKSPGPLSPTTTDPPIVEPPVMQQLRQEEEQIRREEEMEIEQKREAAQRLAITRGLSLTDVKSAHSEVKPDPEDETPSMAVISAEPVTLEPRELGVENRSEHTTSENAETPPPPQNSATEPP